MSSRLKTVVELLHLPGEVALATHSTTLPGYPFATSVNYATDERHRPIMLMSRLAEHTQNVLADPKSSLVAARSLGDGEIARASFIGNATPIEATPHLTSRYLRFNPAANRFLQLGDFHFYRFEPLRIRVVGGFAQAGWLDGKQLLDAPYISLADEAELIGRVQALAPEGLTLLGVDAYGVDFLRDGVRVRTAFKAGPFLADAAEAALVRLLHEL
jgi:putative heme iron utilization protein